MTYAMTLDLPVPVENYDRMHAELSRLVGSDPEGLLVHIGRATATGFQVIEVWESQEQLDHYNRTVVWPLSERLFGGGEMPTPTVEEFDVRGLVVPTGGVFV